MNEAIKTLLYGLLWIFFLQKHDNSYLYFLFSKSNFIIANGAKCTNDGDTKSNENAK